MNRKSVKFAVLLFSAFFQACDVGATTNLAVLNFPLVCDDAISWSPPKEICSEKIHASPDLASYCITSLANSV